MRQPVIGLDFQSYLPIAILPYMLLLAFNVFNRSACPLPCPCCCSYPCCYPCPCTCLSPRPCNSLAIAVPPAVVVASGLAIVFAPALGLAPAPAFAVHTPIPANFARAVACGVCTVVCCLQHPPNHMLGHSDQKAAMPKLLSQLRVRARVPSGLQGPKKKSTQRQQHAVLRGVGNRILEYCRVFAVVCHVRNFRISVSHLATVLCGLAKSA